jgi:hypothetical protein
MTVSLIFGVLLALSNTSLSIARSRAIDQREYCSAIAACSVRFHRAVRELQQFVVSQKSLSFSLYNLITFPPSSRASFAVSIW